MNENVNGMPVEPERPSTDSYFELPFLCIVAVLFFTVSLAPVLSWVFVAPLILLLVGMELHQPLNIDRIGLLLVCLVFAVPSAYRYTVESHTLFGPLGIDLVLSSSGSYLMSNDPVTGFLMISFQNIPQIAFIALLWKHYQGAMTRRTTVMLGIMGQIPFALIVVRAYVQSPMPVFWMFIPLPSVLIIGLIILWLFPP